MVKTLQIFDSRPLLGDSCCLASVFLPNVGRLDVTSDVWLALVKSDAVKQLTELDHVKVSMVSGDELKRVYATVFDTMKDGRSASVELVDRCNADLTPSRFSKLANSRFDLAKTNHSMQRHTTLLGRAPRSRLPRTAVAPSSTPLVPRTAPATAPPRASFSSTSCARNNDYGSTWGQRPKRAPRYSGGKDFFADVLAASPNQKPKQPRLAPEEDYAVKLNLHAPPDPTQVTAAAEAHFAALQAAEQPSHLLSAARQFATSGITPAHKLGSVVPVKPTRAMYNSVLWALAQLGTPERLLAVLEEMPRAGIPRDATAWKYYFEACGVARDAERLRQGVIAMTETDGIAHTQETWEAIFLAYLESAEYERGIATMHSMRAWYHDAAMQLAGREQRAAALDKHYLTWPTVRRALRMLITGHRVNEVAGLYVELQNQESVPILFWADLAKTFARNDYLEYAKQTFQKLVQEITIAQERARTAHGAYMRGEPQSAPILHELLDEGTLSSLLEMAGRMGQPQLASQVLRVMKSQGMPPSTHYFACLVQAFALARDFKSVFTVFTLMRRAGCDPHAAAAVFLSPTPTTNELPISDLAEWRSAALLLPVLRKSEVVDIECITALISVAHRLFADHLGLGLYQQCEELGVEPDLHTIHAALLCTYGNRDARAALLADMEARKLTPTASTYKLLIHLAIRDAGSPLNSESANPDIAAEAEEGADQGQYRPTGRIRAHPGPNIPSSLAVEAAIVTAQEEAASSAADGEAPVDQPSSPHQPKTPEERAAAVEAAFDRAFGLLELANAQRVVDRGPYITLLRAALRHQDPRWRQLVAEMRERGYIVDSRTAEAAEHAFPNDPLTFEIVRAASAMSRRRMPAMAAQLPSTRGHGGTYAEAGRAEEGDHDHSA
ncbi:hypothetical protein H9P43_003686 [Blastocladiella emersonii ATCC 22665]|nr:hypothetical protein H9P43_003686 [Blastocladiella emersonii ATCC 22665]